jgi:GT2 family glycosyltransferase
MTQRCVAVTIGVPTLDRPAAIARCLDALLEGHAIPAELIVVDQGSELPASDVVTARSGGAVQLRYVRQSHRGLSAARNLIVKEARHPLVVVTDDDCVPDPAWLAEIMAAFDRVPVPDAVTGRVLALPGDDARPHAVSLRTGINPRDFVGETLPWLVGTGANFAANRELLARVGGYDERFGAGSAGQAAEDIELSLRLLRAGARIRYEPRAVIYHERQSEARRLTTRWSYAYGIGALTGMLWRRGDGYGTTIMSASLRNVARRLGRAVMARNASGIRQAMLSLRGIAGGVQYGWRIGGAGKAHPLNGDGIQKESTAGV